MPPVPPWTWSLLLVVFCNVLDCPPPCKPPPLASKAWPPKDEPNDVAPYNFELEEANRDFLHPLGFHRILLPPQHYQTFAGIYVANPDLRAWMKVVASRHQDYLHQIRIILAAAWASRSPPDFSVAIMKSPPHTTKENFLRPPRQHLHLIWMLFFQHEQRILDFGRTVPTFENMRWDLVRKAVGQSIHSRPKEFTCRWGLDTMNTLEATIPDLYVLMLSSPSITNRDIKLFWSRCSCCVEYTLESFPPCPDILLMACCDCGILGCLRCKISFLSPCTDLDNRCLGGFDRSEDAWFAGTKCVGGVVLVDMRIRLCNRREGRYWKRLKGYVSPWCWYCCEANIMCFHRKSEGQTCNIEASLPTST